MAIDRTGHRGHTGRRAHIPELLDRIEHRLGDLAGRPWRVLAEHAGATIAAGGKRLRPLLVSWPPTPRTATGWCAPPPRSSSSTRRRSSTTTCSTAPRCGAACRPSWSRPAGAAPHRHRRPAVRARVRRARAQRPRRRDPGAVRGDVGAGRGRAAAARRRLGRRGAAGALPAPLRAQDRAPVRGGLPAGRARGRRRAGGARRVRPAHRARLPAPRRRPRRLGARRSARASTAAPTCSTAP